MESERPSRSSPSVARVLRGAAFDIYDSLWACAGWSFAFWVGPYFGLAALLARNRLGDGGAVGLVALGCVAFSLALAAVLSHAHLVVGREESGPGSTLAGAYRLWGRAVVWLVLNAFVAGAGAVDLAFYVQARSLWVALLGAAWLYLFIFWLGLQMYAGPGLAGGARLVPALRNAALLVLDNLRFTAGVGGLLLGVLMVLAAPFAARIHWLAAVSAALAMFLAPGAAAVVATEAYVALVASYREVGAAGGEGVAE